MTNGLESAQQRLANSPRLAAAVQREIANGLLERMGAPIVSPATAGTDALEARTTPAALEAIVRRVGRPPLLIRNDAVVLGTGVGDSLDDFPPGTDAFIRGTEKDIPSVGRIEFVNFRTGGAAPAG